MNKSDTEKNHMRPEYDFSGGVRGKHHRSYRTGANLVWLERDVAAVFKDSESVNRALRGLMENGKKFDLQARGRR